MEPLILFTAWLGQLDNRLLDESLDWCISNSRLISATRFAGLLKQSEPAVGDAFGTYAATIGAHAPKIRWPGAGKPRHLTPSGKSETPALERAALLQLRLRALFGVGTRAEVLRLLLIEVRRGWSAAELARESGYAKVNIAAALDLLALAGAVRVDKLGNQYRYWLDRGPELADLLGTLPGFQPDWQARFAVMMHLTRLELEPARGEGAVRTAQLLGPIRRIEVPLKRLGLADLMPGVGNAEFNAELDRWSEQLLSYWSGHEMRLAPAEAIYEVHRDEIAWEATIREPGRPPSPLTLPDWEDLYKEAPRSDYKIADDSSGALLLAHELFRRAFARKGIGLEPFRYQSETIAFAQQHLRTLPRGQSRSFGETYLRLWRAERVGRMAGGG